MIVTDLYITRDKDGHLTGHFTKPERRRDFWISYPIVSMLCLDDGDYPDDYYDNLRDEIRNLKFEHDPIKVNVVLKIDDIEKKDE